MKRKRKLQTFFDLVNVSMRLSDQIMSALINKVVGCGYVSKNLVNDREIIDIFAKQIYQQELLNSSFEINKAVQLLSLTSLILILCLFIFKSLFIIWFLVTYAYCYRLATNYILYKN